MKILEIIWELKESKFNFSNRVLLDIPDKRIFLRGYYNMLRIINSEDLSLKNKIYHKFGEISCGLNIKESDFCCLGMYGR